MGTGAGKRTGAGNEEEYKMKHHERIARRGVLPSGWQYQRSACLPLTYNYGMVNGEPVLSSSSSAVHIGAESAAIAVRAIRAGESVADALTLARRSAEHLASGMDRTEIIRGNGYYVTRCAVCGERILHGSYTESVAAAGTACRRCSPTPKGSGTPMAPDSFTVVKGRTRKGKPTAEVRRRSDWTVTGSTVLRPSDLTADQTDALAAVGMSVAAWTHAWNFTLTGIRRRSDGISGMAVARAADSMFDRRTGPGDAVMVPSRAGSANGLAWQQIRSYPPMSPVLAQHTAGITGGFWNRETLPDLDDRGIMFSDDCRTYSVDRSTIADLADVRQRPTASRLPSSHDALQRGYTRDDDGNMSPVIGRYRKSETPEWARPLRFGPWTVSYLYGPTLPDGKVTIGHAAIVRGALVASAAGAAADAARLTVDGERRRTVRASQTVGDIEPDQCPTAVDGWEMLAEMLAPGERFTFAAATGVFGSVKRGRSGRYSGRVTDGADVVKLAGVRSAAALARHLDALTT